MNGSSILEPVFQEPGARMRIALASRGFTARNPRHWPVVARSAGALFIRSYERGERVHLAMVSRGHGLATTRERP